MEHHEIGTRDEWTAARARLREREDEITRLMREAAEERRALPWVAVEKEYSFETEDGPKTLAELFDGRSQLLIYNLMFGPGYTGACPGCSGLADHFDGGIAHLNARDVTMTAISRAPLEKILAYKRRMGWSFPWVSSHGSDYPYDYGFALTDEQIHSPQMAELIGDPPEFLREWSESVGTNLEDGLVEGPGWIVFALQDGAVYHTYSRHAPDGELLAPYYYLLLDQTPQGRVDELRATRHDEYAGA